MTAVNRTHWPNFFEAIAQTKRALTSWGQDVDTGHWQGVPTEGKPDLMTREILDWAFSCPIPSGPSFYLQDSVVALQELIGPNLPWAEDHFQERVEGVPTNPGEEYKNWPWWREGSEKTTMRQINQTDVDQYDLVFDHTYQERFWPKHAGERVRAQIGPLEGIRYEYGDLEDVVDLLMREPMTRQAYLPIFFPEDTGAVHGGRIPCSLGYHFMLRNDRLHLWYEIRSCDYVRHFKDDVYLAARLLVWMLQRLRDESIDRADVAVSHAETDREEAKAVGLSQLWHNVTPGTFHFLAHSLHYHRGDEHLVN